MTNVMVGAAINQDNYVELTFAYQDDVVTITLEIDNLLELSKMLEKYYGEIKKLGPVIGTGMTEEVM